MFGVDPLGEEFKIDESDFVHGLPKIMNGWLQLAETIMTNPPKPSNFDRNIELHDLMKKFCAVSELANKQLEKMGYNIGVRIIEDFLARTKEGKCTDFRDTADKVQTAFKMYLNVSPTVTSWSSSSDEFSLIFEVTLLESVWTGHLI